MAFEFEAVNENFYEEEYANQQKQSLSNSQTPILYLKDGITVVRFMPPAKGSNGRWMRKIFEHQAKFGDKFITATCPRMIQQDCPICDLGEKLKDEGKIENNPEKLEQGKRLGYRVQFLANVICYSSPDPENGSLAKGVMVTKFGSRVKAALLDLDQAVDTGWAKITDIANGVDIRITRAGRGLQTQYTVMPMGARSNLQAKLAASGIDLGSLTLHNLEDVLNPRSYDDLASMMAGQSRTPGFLPKPVTQAQAVPVAQVSVTVPVAQQAAPQEMPQAAVVTPNFQAPAPTPTVPGSFVVQPIQSVTAPVPVAVPQIPGSPPPVGMPVREVK